MTSENDILVSRLKELSQRADRYNIPQYSDFLDLSAQASLHIISASLPSGYRLFGGHPLCERVIAGFGAGDDSSFPISCTFIHPSSARFAEELTHRDFMGSILALGIKRETVGDIFVKNSLAYVFATEAIGAFIRDSLVTVKRTDVHCEISEGCSDAFLPDLVPTRVNVASDRLDAVISAVWHVARGTSSAFVAAKKVFINGRLTEDSSKQLHDGDIVSLRGTGRFRYDGIDGRSKKDRLFVNISKYE